MFDQAIVHVLDNEGGYVEHKSDPGGATKYGVSLRFLQSIGSIGDLNKDGVVNKTDIRDMKKESAVNIYQKFWWEKYGYGGIKDARIATKILDMSINLGPFNAHCILQKALNNYGKKIKVDGVIGSETIDAINSCPDKNKLLTYIIVNLSRYYLTLYNQDKKNRVHFIVGWLTRAVKKQ